ncbi:MAG: PspC domain-containing protein [Candidatus Promineifilaceae bacterium]|nr:PspC domain-containing protein [Candidatus Promineifilaceae bacterium]
MNEKRLTRSQNDRMLFGVAGGLAEYFNVDPVLIRLAFVLLVLGHGSGLLLYLVLAILMPEEMTSAKANGFDEDEIVVQDAS